LSKAKVYRAADEVEVSTLKALDAMMATLPDNADAETIQNQCLAVARGFERYRDPVKTNEHGQAAVTGAFFQMLYQILLAAEKGPRFGSFVQLYGIANTQELIARGVSGELAKAA
jgi:lysyl-tRNA synthetase, class I